MVESLSCEKLTSETSVCWWVSGAKRECKRAAPLQVISLDSFLCLSSPPLSDCLEAAEVVVVKLNNKIVVTL